jgi:hypothetical protein
MYEIPIYEAKIKGTDNTGIYAMSFVDYPATGQDFVALVKSSKPVKMVRDNAKHILTGAVLVPNQLIYRYDEGMGEYYLRFSASEIEKISQKMMRQGLTLSTTHQHDKPLKGNYLTEMWIVKDSKKDKANALGLGELPKGTLVASYKISDPYYWREEVMTGHVRGFSIEGLFNFNKVKMSKKTEQKKTEKGGLFATVPAFLKSLGTLLEGESAAAAEGVAEEAVKDETDSGTPYLIFTLADGGEIWVDEAGFATIDGEQAPAGQHTLDDGNYIEIGDDGVMVVTTPEAESTAAEEAAATLARQRGKAFLAKLAAAGKPTGKPAGKPAQKPNAEVAKLKAEMAALQAKLKKMEGEPSVPPAQAGAGTEEAPTTPTGRMALAMRRARERREAMTKKV